MASTRVKVSGFEMQFSEGIEMNDFYQELEQMSRKKQLLNVGNYNARLYTRVVDNLAVGLVLTFKDDKKKLASETDQSGKLKVNRIELKENQTSTEASLFCFNPSTKFGLFTHYAGAASVSVYNSIFNQAHKVVKERSISQYVDEHSRGRTKGSISTIRSRAQSEFSGQFQFKHIYQEKDLNQILDNLKTLSEIEVTTELGIPDEPCFRHLGSAVKRTTQTVSFLDRFKHIDNLRNHLANFIHDAFSSKDKKYALRLIGSSLSGQRAQYWIGDNVEEYRFFDYEKYIDELPEEVWDTYYSCPALVSIIGIVKEKSETFGVIKSTDTWGKYQSVSDLNEQPCTAKAETGSLKTLEEFKGEKPTQMQFEMSLFHDEP